MKSAGALALYGAALPFVTPWKALDSHLEVVSLDADAPDWGRLLAGQGIGLRDEPDPLPQDCAVATGFDRLDSLTAGTLGPWAAEAARALRPGGILVLGARGLHPSALPPETAAEIIAQAGFARVRVIHPPLPADDTSLASALCQTGQAYAVVAQKAGRGKAFDVFSPVFAEAPLLPRQDRLQRAEAALHHRIDEGLHRTQADLHHSLTRSEADLRERLEAAEASLREQRRELDALQATLAEVRRLTRRRGLRKLVHRLKQKWRGDRTQDKSADAATGPGETAAELPRSADLLIPPAPRPPADPVPLSPRERAVRRQLHDPGAD